MLNRFSRYSKNLLKELLNKFRKIYYAVPLALLWSWMISYSRGVKINTQWNLFINWLFKQKTLYLSHRTLRIFVQRLLKRDPHHSTRNTFFIVLNTDSFVCFSKKHLGSKLGIFDYTIPIFFESDHSLALFLVLLRDYF